MLSLLLLHCPSPLSSDHSPIVTLLNLRTVLNHRFIFKNYWVSLEGFDELIATTWSKYCVGDPIFVLFKKMRNIRKTLSDKTWNSTSFIVFNLNHLKKEQERLRGLLDADPNNHSLLVEMKKISNAYACMANAESLWVKQRAKQAWLAKGEDDLSSSTTLLLKGVIQIISMRSALMMDNSLMSKVSLLLL